MEKTSEKKGYIKELGQKFASIIQFFHGHDPSNIRFFEKELISFKNTNFFKGHTGFDHETGEKLQKKYQKLGNSVSISQTTIKKFFRPHAGGFGCSYQNKDDYSDIFLFYLEYKGACRGEKYDISKEDLQNKKISVQDIEDKLNNSTDPQYNIGTNEATFSGEMAPPLILPTRPEYFLGREDLIKNIIKDLNDGKVVKLWGIPGIGKSAIASEVLWQLTSDGLKTPERFPDGVIWHNFHAEPNIDRIIDLILINFNQSVDKNSYQKAQTLLAQKKILLLLDGTENADNIQKVFNIKGSSGIIITTRKHNDTPSDLYEIGILEKHDSINLLRAWAKNRLTTDKIAQDICELVGHLPLAIMLIGSYLTQTKIFDSEYLPWLKTTPLEALNYGERSHQSFPILINKSLEQVDEYVRFVLGMSGALAFKPFNIEQFVEILKNQNKDTDPFLEKEVMSSVNRAFYELMNYGLFKRSKESKDYEITHPLIYIYADKKLTPPPETINVMFSYFLDQLLPNFPTPSLLTGKKLFQNFSHLANIIRKTPEYSATFWKKVHHSTIMMEEDNDFRKLFLPWLEKLIAKPSDQINDIQYLDGLQDERNEIFKKCHSMMTFSKQFKDIEEEILKTNTMIAVMENVFALNGNGNPIIKRFSKTTLVHLRRRKVENKKQLESFEKEIMSFINMLECFPEGHKSVEPISLILNDLNKIYETIQRSIQNIENISPPPEVAIESIISTHLANADNTLKETNTDLANAMAITFFLQNLHGLPSLPHELHEQRKNNLSPEQKESIVKFALDAVNIVSKFSEKKGLISDIISIRIDSAVLKGAISLTKNINELIKKDVEIKLELLEKREEQHKKDVVALKETILKSVEICEVKKTDGTSLYPSWFFESLLRIFKKIIEKYNQQSIF